MVINAPLPECVFFFSVTRCPLRFLFLSLRGRSSSSQKGQVR